MRNSATLVFWFCFSKGPAFAMALRFQMFAVVLLVSSGFSVMTEHQNARIKCNVRIVFVAL